jgi:hypothetical protein
MWTEEEARARWCPLARYDKNNRHVAGTVMKETLCVASGCMAWRWRHTKAPMTPIERNAFGKNVGLAEALQPTIYVEGYCGAFGAPSGRPAEGVES